MVAQTDNIGEHIYSSKFSEIPKFQCLFTHIIKNCATLDLGPNLRYIIEDYTLKIIRVPNLFTFLYVSSIQYVSWKCIRQMSSSGIACISMCIYLLMLVIAKILDRTFLSLFWRYIQLKHKSRIRCRISCYMCVAAYSAAYSRISCKLLTSHWSLSIPNQCMRLQTQALTMAQKCKQITFGESSGKSYIYDKTIMR